MGACTSASACEPDDWTSDHPWDRAADGWDRHSAQVNAWLREVTEAMLVSARVAPGSYVLDVAAGAGGQTHEIARRVGGNGRVLATDISHRVVALARRSARSAGLHHVETRQADAQTLGLEGAGFDSAVCRLGLMFCADPQKALHGIAAALKPGGRFAGVVFSQPQANPCAAILMTTALKHAPMPLRSPFEAGTLFSLGKPGLLADLLQAAGFVDIEVRPVAAPFRMPSAVHYVDFVRSSGSPIMEILSRLPPGAQADAWDDMSRQLNIYDSANGWEGPNELLFCGACRGRS